MRDELLKKIEALQKESRDKDTELDGKIKEANLLCDKIMNDMEESQADIKRLKSNKTDNDEFEKEIYELKDAISKLGSGQPV